MYWRIRKLTPDMIVKRFSVYAFLIVSVLFNLVLFGRVNASKAAVAPTQRVDFEKFARQVTQHLFDANYLTIDDSMRQLSAEIIGPARKKLQDSEVIPKTEEEVRAIARQLDEKKSVSCVKFERLQLGDKPVDRPVAPGQMVAMQPVDLKVQIIVHDAEGVRPATMNLRYYLAYAPGANKGEQRLVVYDFDQLPDDR